MASQEQIKRLKELIAISLDQCSKDDWPYVCHMNSTPEGHKDIESKIIQICTTYGISVGRALDKIERVFNPNRIDD